MYRIITKIYFDIKTFVILLFIYFKKRRYIFTNRFCFYKPFLFLPNFLFYEPFLFLQTVFVFTNRFCFYVPVSPIPQKIIWYIKLNLCCCYYDFKYCKPGKQLIILCLMLPDDMIFLKWNSINRINILIRIVVFF